MVPVPLYRPRGQICLSHNIYRVQARNALERHSWLPTPSYCTPGRSSTLCCGNWMPRILSCHRNRRTAMQQLSFLDPPPQRGAVPVWEALDKEQRAHLVLRLARLIARAIATAGDHNDERAEQDHR
jgi:hypothetical protein